MNLRHLPIGEAKLIGERLCLDFTNTVGGRNGSEIILEKLKTYDDLVVWSVHAGILNRRDTQRLNKKGAQSVVKRALRLREAIYRICVAALKKESPDSADLKLLNHEIHEARNHEFVDSSFRIRTKSTNKDLDQILWPVALSARQLLTSEDLKRLQQCDSENCGWLFVDTSKNHTRQWCDMSDCGNRAKVRRFRSK
ncbi:CGNR zinc finger domain-containing protein [bacterium]|nr:CGNR zinc finger domain-containing protein [bacterium]